MSALRNNKRPRHRMGMFDILAEVIAIIVIGVGVFTCHASQPGDIVAEAYEMRISGQVDAARDLLTKHLEEDPGDALAHYELARLYCQTVPSNPRQPEMAIQKTQESIAKALELMPDNVKYRRFGAQATFLKSYMGLMRNQGDPAEHVAALKTAYEQVLEVSPNHGPTIMDLVELYGGLPADMGGDSVKAAGYAARLNGIDPILAGKAHCFLMPEDFDRIGYWRTMLNEHPDDAAVLEELGKTCLREGHTDDGVEILYKAIAASGDNALYLVISNHCVLSTMQNRGAAEKAIPVAREALSKFLATDPIAPLRGYALGVMAHLSHMQGDKEAVEKWNTQAKEVDAYYSKATGIPGADLFVRPDEELDLHTYLFQPF
ncbi:MAG: hypothetical protein ABIE70_10875 [bacterium]